MQKLLKLTAVPEERKCFNHEQHRRLLHKARWYVWHLVILRASVLIPPSFPPAHPPTHLLKSEYPAVRRKCPPTHLLKSEYPAVRRKHDSALAVIQSGGIALMVLESHLHPWSRPCGLLGFSTCVHMTTGGIE